MTKIAACKKILEQKKCGGVPCSYCPAYIPGKACLIEGKGGFPTCLPWFEEWLRVNGTEGEDEEEDLDTICAICGERLGVHRVGDYRCPTKDGTGYASTTFKKKGRIVEFQKDHWYRWNGPKERPAGWASTSAMDAMLDGKPRKCLSGSGGAYVEFDGIAGGYWNWQYGIEHFQEVPDPGKEIDPGEGWRLLKDDEIVREGDEVRQLTGEWFPAHDSIARKVGDRKEEWRSGGFIPEVRRKTIIGLKKYKPGIIYVDISEVSGWDVGSFREGLISAESEKGDWRERRQQVIDKIRFRG